MPCQARTVLTLATFWSVRADLRVSPGFCSFPSLFVTPRASFSFSFLSCRLSPKLLLTFLPVFPPLCPSAFLLLLASLPPPSYCLPLRLIPAFLTFFPFMWRFSAVCASSSQSPGVAFLVISSTLFLAVFFTRWQCRSPPPHASLATSAVLGRVSAQVEFPLAPCCSFHFSSFHAPTPLGARVPASPRFLPSRGGLCPPRTLSHVSFLARVVPLTAPPLASATMRSGPCVF